MKQNIYRDSIYILIKKEKRSSVPKKLYQIIKINKKKINK